MRPSLSRRAFLVETAALAAALRVRAWSTRGSSGPAVRLALVGGTARTTDARGMGLILGVEEATHAASLFGGSVTLIPLPAGVLGAGGVSCVIGDSDEARTRDAAARANSAGIPFFNVGCAADGLRGSGCLRTMFHIAPSEAMCRTGLSAAGAAGAKGATVAWDPSLVRFGADTLNLRFHKRFGSGMTPEAWTAWLATKILWESALRMQSADPAKLIQYLTRDTTQFDGHKGVPLSFRPWDHQLRQPLYVVNGGRVIEVPTMTPTAAARPLLDQLGTGSAQTACHLSR